MKHLVFVLLIASASAVMAQPDSANFSKDSLSIKKPVFNKPLTFVPPALFAGYGFLALHNNFLKHIDHNVQADMAEDFPNFAFHADNYLQYAPGAAIYILDAAGLKSAHSLLDQTAMYAISAGILSTSVTLIKHSTHKFRPNGTSYTSFPSGHTATAFAAAEMMYQEYGERSIWYGVAGYTLATATGILRVYNNAHWFSDIIAGAGFGILSAKAAYSIYPRVKRLFPDKHHIRYSMLPSYQHGMAGISVSARFTD